MVVVPRGKVEGAAGLAERSSQGAAVTVCEAWLESAIADPRVALDITPWWADATDGRYLLNRALVLLLVDVLDRSIHDVVLPPGALTSLAGAPFFLWLLRRTETNP